MAPSGPKPSKPTVLTMAAPSAAVAAQAVPGRLERVTLFGNEYVRLDQWAGGNGFKSEWITRNRELRLSNSSTTLLFEADSRKMLINGVSVHLAAPVAVRNGSAFVSDLLL